MSDETHQTPEQEGTDVRRFLLTRGHMLLKEFKPIGNVACSYGQRVDGTVMSISVGDSGISSSVHGLKLEEVRPDGSIDDSNFLDADELSELVDAIGYIRDAARSMLGQSRDYTEAIYVSKDGVKIGFYQSDTGDQLGFVDVGGDGKMVFMPVDNLGMIADLVKQASAFIDTKRQSSPPSSGPPRHLGAV